MSDRKPPPPYLGDYPNGAYWAALLPPGSAPGDETSFEVAGVIRFRMPEDDVDLPLWDDEGLMPWESELLEAGLGLSADLIADVKAWGVAWNASPRANDPAGEGRESRRERLAAEAALLVDRMSGELKDGLRVELDLR